MQPQKTVANVLQLAPFSLQLPSVVVIIQQIIWFCLFRTTIIIIIIIIFGKLDNPIKTCPSE